MGIALILLSTPVEDWLQDHVSNYYDFCAEQQVQEGSVCKRVLGFSAVYHVCLAGALYFLFMALLMLCAKSSSDPRVKFDRGFWLWKFLLLIGCIVAVFFIPTTNAFYTTMYVFGLIGGFVFICVQILMLIGSMVTMYTGALVGAILLFIYFTSSSCVDNIIILIVQIVLCVVISVMSILPKIQEENPRSGLLQASLTSLFAIGLTWMALSSDPRSSCNPSGDTAQWTSIVIALLLTDFTVLIASGTSSNEDSSSNYAADGGEEGAGGQAVIDDEEDSVSYNHSLFHLAKAAACLYIMMTLTQWFSPTEVDGNMNDDDFTDSNVSKWVKISSSWVCFAVYIWVLIAPIILTDREF